MNKFTGLVRRCVEDYEMIQDGEVIAVGVSGGKDSLALLCALNNLKRYYPKKFELHAITVDMGYDEMDFSGVERLCDELKVPYTIKRTQMKQIIFDERHEKNPCALCAKMRRGALAGVLNREGYNKLALGHHADDVAQTLLMSMIYEGRLNTFKPISEMTRTGVTVIRPFVYVDEKDIVALCGEENIPVVKNPCPADGGTKRGYVGDLLKRLDKETGYLASENIKRAIFNPERNSLWNECERREIKRGGKNETAE